MQTSFLFVIGAAAVSGQYYGSSLGFSAPYSFGSTVSSTYGGYNGLTGYSLPSASFGSYAYPSTSFASSALPSTWNYGASTLGSTFGSYTSSWAAPASNWAAPASNWAAPRVATTTATSSWNPTYTYGGYNSALSTVARTSVPLYSSTARVVSAPVVATTSRVVSSVVPTRISAPLYSSVARVTSANKCTQLFVDHCAKQNMDCAITSRGALSCIAKAAATAAEATMGFDAGDSFDFDTFFADIPTPDPRFSDMPDIDIFEGMDFPADIPSSNPFLTDKPTSTPLILPAGIYPSDYPTGMPFANTTAVATAAPFVGKPCNAAAECADPLSGKEVGFWCDFQDNKCKVAGPFVGKPCNAAAECFDPLSGKEMGFFFCDFQDKQCKLGPPELGPPAAVVNAAATMAPTVAP